MSKKIPALPAVTPFQFIALLDELCLVGCCDTGEKKGVSYYQISIRQIEEGDAILAGKNDGSHVPVLLSPAAPPPPALTPAQFIAILDEICGVDDRTRRSHRDDEIYMVTTGDIINGLGRIFGSRPA